MSEETLEEQLFKFLELEKLEDALKEIMEEE